jgi:hypothetical protein
LIPFREESSIEVIDQTNWLNVFCFIKEWESVRALVVMNKDILKKQKVNISNVETSLKTDKIKDFSPENRIDGYIKNLNI